MKMGRVVLVVLVLALAAVGAQAGDQDFSLVNKTGVVINALYVSPADEAHWGEDILGVDQLADGETVDITFSRDEDAALWDLKVADEDGNSIVWENLNLLEISTITLKYAGGKATAVTK